MARPVRIEYEVAVYHVTARGNNRNAIFADDADRERFLLDLEESVQRFDIRLYLFCLMTNHVHLVLETPRGNLSSFMHRVQTAYTVYFNRRHHQSGHLMQGRFGAAAVDEDEYILKLSRYVHLNPVFVQAHRSKSPRERTEILRAYPCIVALLSLGSQTLMPPSSRPSNAHACVSGLRPVVSGLEPSMSGV